MCQQGFTRVKHPMQKKTSRINGFELLYLSQWETVKNVCVQTSKRLLTNVKENINWRLNQVLSPTLWCPKGSVVYWNPGRTLFPQIMKWMLDFRMIVAVHLVHVRLLMSKLNLKNKRICTRVKNMMKENPLCIIKLWLINVRTREEIKELEAKSCTVQKDNSRLWGTLVLITK